MNSGKIITISGFPGAGKSHLKDYLIKNMKNVEPAQIITTKSQEMVAELNPDVENVTKEQFQKDFFSGKLCGVSFSNDVWWAFKTDQVERIEDGICFVAELPYEVLADVRDDFGDNVISIHIFPKDIDRAKKELQYRFPNPKALREELKEIENEIDYYKNNSNICDIVIKNDYTEKTCEDLKRIIEEKVLKKLKNDKEIND